jgi:hypothetical protein
MFLMSMPNSGDLYGALGWTEHVFEAKAMHMLTFKYFTGSAITLA